MVELVQEIKVLMVLIRQYLELVLQQLQVQEVEEEVLLNQLPHKLEKMEVLEVGVELVVLLED